MSNNKIGFLNVPILDGGVSVTRAIILLLSAFTLHTLGLVSVAGPFALSYVDHVTFSSVSVTFFGHFVAAIAVSRLINQFFGAEFPYKAMRKDRGYGRPLLPKSEYINLGEKAHFVIEPVISIILFVVIYYASVVSVMIFLAPMVIYIFLYILHVFWALSNRFRQNGQLLGPTRWFRVFRKSKKRAFRSLRAILYGWMRPRLLGLAALLMISSGIARGVTLQENYIRYNQDGQHFEAAMLFKSSSGFVLLSERSSIARSDFSISENFSYGTGDVWFLSNSGFLIELIGQKN